jgi:hypothetical protein
MAPLLTEKVVGDALSRLGRYRVAAANEAAMEGPSDGIGGHHLLVVGLRESHLKNINNSTDTDHGCFQISENYHLPFLRSQPGCPEGSWQAVEDHMSDETGYCPRYTPAMNYALNMLKEFKKYAEYKGVPKTDSLRVAFNGYNRGVAGAIRVYKEAGSSGNPDLGTTGNDYGSWCLTHSRMIKKWLDEHPNWKVLPE